jgi:hypothetical protein
MAGLAIPEGGCVRDSRNFSKCPAGNAILAMQDTIHDFTQVSDTAMASVSLAAGGRAALVVGGAALKVDSAGAEGECSTRAISSWLF